MKKALVLSAVAATLGLGAMTASAIPNGYESVNIHATLNAYNFGSKLVKVSISNKDILALVQQQFGGTIPNGAQLVSYGLSSEEFAVLYSNGAVWDANVSSGSGDYYLYFYPEDDSYEVDSYVTGTGDTYNYMDGSGYLEYRSYSGSYVFYLAGLTKWQVNGDNDNESYNLSNGAGYFDLPIGGDDYGTMTGSVSGSGKAVNDAW